MNKKQLKELGDATVYQCFNCGLCKLFYDKQEGSITILDESKCCDEPSYGNNWDWYEGVEKCGDCNKETVWFTKCYKCGKIICEDCTEYHYVEIESGLQDFCKKCHDSIEHLDMVYIDDELYKKIKFSEWKREIR